MLSKPGEANGVGFATKTGAQHAVVAGQFTLRAEAVIYPEENGIQWEKRQADLLQQIGPIVTAAEVLHLVQDYLLQLERREFFQERRWNEDTRAEETKHAGPLYFSRGAELC
jgi:hypothetical protein